MLSFLDFDGVYFGCGFLGQDGVTKVSDELEDLRRYGVTVICR